jgi:DegV family protein with EDD domain
MKFNITTDSTCDIRKTVLAEKGVPYIATTYTLPDRAEKDKIYEDNFSYDEEYIEFYKALAGGELPVTSLINAFRLEEFFFELASRDKTPILHLPLSGGLANTVHNARAAAAAVMERVPGSKIIIVETLSATQGQGYLVDRAIELRDADIEPEKAAEFLTELATRLHHWLVVDDLMHLKRGGRIGGANAVIGSILNIKPVLIINDEGKMAIVKKTKGTAKAIDYLVSMLKEYAAHPENLVCYLANAGADDKVEELKRAILASFPDAKIQIGWVGPIIGTHTGAGSMGLVFEGTGRLNNK